MLFLHAVRVRGLQFLAEPGPELLVESEARRIVFQDGKKVGFLLVPRG